MSLPNNLQLCRLCLFEKNSYVDIFEINEKHGFRISDVINEMLELDVSPGDGLPERICEDCLTEMARFKRFKKLCQEAKLTLNCIIALAAGTVPPPTSLPSFLTASQNSISDSAKSTDSLSVSKNTCVPVTSSALLSTFVNTVPVNTNCVTSTSAKATSSCQTAVQVNLDTGSSSAAIDVVTPQVAQVPLQNPTKFENNQVDNEQQTENFGEAQEDSDLDNLCDGPLPVETVLSEPDTEAVQGSRLVGGGLPVIPTNGGVGNSLGMFPISSIMNDLHQFPAYAPTGARIDHSIFENPREPEVVDLVDDEDGEAAVVVLPDSYPVAEVLLPHSGDDSGNSLPGSERSGNLKYERNEDSDLENMCEDPLPVETVLSEPESELGSGAAKCGGEQNALDARDDSFGLFSLTSTFGDLMASSEDNGCLSRTSHAAILSAEQSPQERAKEEAVGSGQLNNPDKYPFWCPVCGKNFMRKDKLKQHSVVHSNERPFICRICGCSYKRKDKLTSHVTSSHLQHLPHQCDICGKRFVRKDKLKQHSVVHSNRRPYVCKECGKMYKLKTELKKHEKRTHSQENPA